MTQIEAMFCFLFLFFLSDLTHTEISQQIANPLWKKYLGKTRFTISLRDSGNGIVLCSAGTESIFTRSWLGWPKQPIKWDILYHVMPCSVFKWAAGWRRRFCYSGASWASGGENTACCICFYQYYWLLFSSPFAILWNCSHPNPRVFAFFSFGFSSPSHRGGGRSERVTVWFFVGNWGRATTGR